MSGAPLSRDALLRLVDLNTWEMYREISRTARGSELFETPELTMVRRPYGTPWHNMVMVRDRIDAAVLLAAVARFYAGGRPFSIWTRAHADAPLAATLRVRGFIDLVPMAGMVLFEDPGTRCAPPGLEIRPVTSEAERRDYVAVSIAAYVPTFQLERALVEDTLPTLASLSAPHVQGFVGYVGGVPVAAAGVWLSYGVAGINWVGTVPNHRGRRYAEALVWMAVREGFRRGGRFASLQPTHLGRPVYERMGFVAVAEYPVLATAT
jgi:acetyltransferase (GNAT) family protein